jgi:pilus assembly protein CpaC
MTAASRRLRRPALVRSRLPHLAAVLACLCVGVLAGSAAGQEAETLATEGQLTMEVSKGRVIRLPRPAATVFVADPEIADVQAQSASIVYLFGRRTGTTSLYAIDENDQLLVRTSVTVQHNLSGLRQAIGELMPGAQVTASTVDGSIVLDGLVENPVQAQDLRELAERFLGEETLLFRVGVASPTQVNLRVRVAEVSRDVLKEFGINWEAIFANGNFTFGFVSGRAVSDGAGSFLRSPTGADSAFGSWQSGDDFINTALDALAEEGLVNVLAEPNLTALSGETASFLAGGEFPIPIDSDEDGLEIEFKNSVSAWRSHRPCSAPTASASGCGPRSATCPRRAQSRSTV